MIHVWYSNQLERLADILVDNLARQRGAFPASVFDKACLIVPNRNVATFLQYTIARTAGIAANLEFHFLEAFINELIFKVHPDYRALTRGQLQSLLLGLFEDSQALADPELAPVRTYLDADGPGDPRHLHAFQLAGRLARLFEDYSFSRPEMLSAWASGQGTLLDSSLSGTEQWQRAVWQRLFRAGGRLEQARWHQPSLQPGQDRCYLLATDLFTVLVREGWGTPAHLHFFGLSYVSRVHQGLLAALARRSELHLYTLAPAQEDLGAEQPVRPKMPARREVALFSISSSAEPPAYDLDQTEAHLALRLWGKPGREYLRLLRDLPDVSMHPSFESPAQPAPGLLGRLQQDILKAAPEVRETVAGEASATSADDSIVILACPGIQRETEVIANEIWSLIREDHEPADIRAGSVSEGRPGDEHPSLTLAARRPGRLRFNDIAVIIAGEQHREAYQTHLRAVFGELYDIPFNLMDSRLARVSRVVEAVEKLLELPLGRFTRPGLLGFLTHPAVRARFPEADADEWRGWCEEASIFHGADRQEHHGLYIEKDLYNWDQGLRRLVLGAFLAGSRTGDDRVFEIGSDSYVPLDFAESRLASAGRFVSLVRSLIADARFARDQHLPLADWAAFLAKLVSTYVGVEDEEDERALGRCLKVLYGLREFDLSGLPVPYRMACEFARQELAFQSGTRGQYLAEGVVISSFLPMRALPFRIVFICGLSEGQFPARDGADPLDLTRARRNAGDVSPRERDKYLFLETLDVTRERLYLSYIARDNQTGEELEPSSLIRELQQVLRRGYLSEEQVQNLTRRYPLRRYDEKYFPASGPAAYRNYSPAALREALAGYLRHQWQAPGTRPIVPTADDLRRLGGDLSAWLGLCRLPDPAPDNGSRETLAISIRALRRFLECPLQGWARLRLRLREEEYEDEVARADESFVTEPRERAVLLREVFFDALCDSHGSGKPPDFDAQYEHQAALLELQGVLPTGLFNDIQRKAHREILLNWYDNLKAVGLAERGPFEVWRFGRAEEQARVQVRPPIVLDVNLPADRGNPRQVRVELYGKTEMLAAVGTRSLRLGVSKKETLRECLQGFLDYLCLLLSDPADREGYEVIVLPAEGGVNLRRSFMPVSRKAAREYLQALLADLLGGPHDYFLPCEAVFEFWRSENKKLEKIVENLRENRREPCSSFFGPIPRAEHYPIPDEARAREIMARRFGLFFQERQPA
jgi:exodeoxyribonuclease V gamma subunit